MRGVKMCSNTLSSLAVFADFLITHKPTVAMEILQVEGLNALDLNMHVIHSTAVTIKYYSRSISQNDSK